MKRVNEELYKNIHNALDIFPEKHDKEVALLAFMVAHQGDKEISLQLIEYAFTYGMDQCLGIMLQRSQEYRNLFKEQNAYGRTLYHSAMDYDLPYTCKVAMTRCGDAPSIQDRNGDTFLHEAVRRGYKATCDTIVNMLTPNYKPFGPSLENFKPEAHLSPSCVEIKNKEGKSVRDLYKERFKFELPSKEHPNGCPVEDEHVD